MHLRAVVVGIPGVGKTTVLDGLEKVIRGIKVVNFGTVMLEQAMRKKLVKDRDELRRLPVEKQRELQAFAARRIARMKGKIVVDTHLFIRTGDGFWPGLPFSVLSLLRPTHLFLIEADPSEITSRRERDKVRYRDIVSLEQIEQELSIARAFLATCSVLTGAPMMIIKNHEGKSYEAIEAISKVIGVS